MTKINLVYENDYDDADILLVPKDAAESIDETVQLFFDWVHMPEQENRFKVLLHGRLVTSIGTKEFLWWLNNIYHEGKENAYLIAEHVSACPDYPFANF